MKNGIVLGFCIGLFSLNSWAQKHYQQNGIILDSYTFDEIQPVLFPKDEVTYLINFWATWCAPCVKELPYFDQLQAELGSDKFQVVLVSLDFSSQIEKRLIPFLQKKQLKANVLHLGDPDADAWINKVHPSWSGAIPATLLYNHAKGLYEFRESEFTEAELRQFISTYYQL